MWQVSRIRGPCTGKGDDAGKRTWFTFRGTSSRQLTLCLPAPSPHRFPTLLYFHLLVVSCPHSSLRVLSPRVSSVSSVAATSHCRHGFFSDAVQAASSLVRSFPVHVPSTSSRCPLSLFSIFSRSPLSLLTLFLCSNVLPRLTRRALASSPHIVASPSHASLIACLHYFSRSPCTYPQVCRFCKNCNFC